MDTTNTGTLTPPIDIQREPSAPYSGLYSATVNMLQETRDVLYPQNYPNMTMYQMPAMPAMVNQSTGDLSGHYFQYAPGIGQYPMLQSSARSINNSVIITNTTNIITNTTDITTTSTAGTQSKQSALPKMNAGTLLSRDKNSVSNRDASKIEKQQPALGDFGSAPPWFSQTMQIFGTKLQQIENHLVTQGLKWQNIEASVLKQNDRIGSVEKQVSGLNNLKQSMTKLQISSESNERETKKLSSKMAEYDNTIHTYSEMCDDIKSEQTTCRAENNEIYERLEYLEREQQELKDAVVKSDKTIIDLQCRSMRDNLIFTGISEPQYSGENAEAEFEDVEQSLRTFLTDEMQISRYMPFHRVHRLNSLERGRRNEGPKPIIAKFERFSDREYVRGQAPKTLVNKPFGVREQFPKAIEEKRRQLYPIMKQYRKDKSNKVRLVRDKLYINGYEYYPPEDEQNNTGSDRNRPSGDYKRYTKTRIFDRSTKPRRPQQSFSHPTGRTYAPKVLDFSLPTGNSFAPLQDNTNPGVSWKDRVESRKNKASSPLDADKHLKKHRENSNSNSNSESESDTESDNMQLGTLISPQSEPPRDEGRTLPQSPIIAVPVPMYQGGTATNENGTITQNDVTHSDSQNEQNSNTVD